MGGLLGETLARDGNQLEDKEIDLILYQSPMIEYVDVVTYDEAREISD